MSTLLWNLAMIPNPWTGDNLCPLQSSDGGTGVQPFVLAEAAREVPAPRNISGKQEGRTGIEVGTSQTPGSPMLSARTLPIPEGQASLPSEALPPLLGLQISNAGDTLDEERFMAEIEEPPAFIVAPSQGYLLSCEREQTEAIIEFLVR